MHLKGEKCVFQLSWNTEIFKDYKLKFLNTTLKNICAIWECCVAKSRKKCRKVSYLVLVYSYFIMKQSTPSVCYLLIRLV